MTAARPPSRCSTTSRHLTGLGLFALSLLLVACGGGNSAPSAGGAETTHPAEPATTAPGTDAAFPVTINHKFGTTEIPEEPERVLSLRLQRPGSHPGPRRHPVAVRYWYGDQPDATWPWAQDELGFNSVLSLPFALEELVPMLEQALDGEPGAGATPTSS